MSHTLVFDIGKTHSRCVVFDAYLRGVYRDQRANALHIGLPYPQLDVDGLWQWMCSALRAAATQFPIGAINIATHGATAALIDTASGSHGLALPVLDYEYDAPSLVDGYETLRPEFAETLSPSLPAGLNLGRQFWWQQRRFPGEFARASAILMYPQYWAWRLGGDLVTESTSLGCHTDLWQPQLRDYSSLARKTDWHSKFPSVVPAWSPIGTLREELARELALPADCTVFPGVHDSNAGFARHLRAARGRPFVLVSTGTWVVCMAAGAPVNRLNPVRDMLANVDVNGNAVACARFMGGREYSRICELTGSDPAQWVTLTQVQATIDAGVLALPDFSGGSGPAPGREGRITAVPEHGGALATLYLALMIELELELLDADGDVLIEGAFAANAVLCALVAALCARPVYVAGAVDATALGAAMLCHWNDEIEPAQQQACEPCKVHGLGTYRARWRDHINHNN